jgi:predicted AAA+ superfamily ATPase
MDMSKEFKRKSESEQGSQQKASGSEKVSFGDWFSLRLASNRDLQAHHYEAILAYFKSKNLSDQESPEDFDAELKKFGF